MRWLFFFLFLVTAGFLAVAGEENVVQEFSGSGSTTTELFKVRERWEVRWNARQAVSVAVMSADGTIVAGAAGVLRGSLFVPQGGQFYLKISDGTVALHIPVKPAPAAPLTPEATNSASSTPPLVTNASPAVPAPTTTNSPSSTPTPAANAPPAVPTPTTTNSPSSTPTPAANAAPATPTPATTNSPPSTPPPAASAPSPASPPATTNNAPSAPEVTNILSLPEPEPVISWHLQVVQLGKSVASDQALSVYTPYFIVPDSAVTPAAPPPNVPPPTLTDAQVHAVVTVKGENAQGAGFLMRSADGTCYVVTHLRLLAANPNVHIFTNSGAPITPVSFMGAVDRDLAFLPIQDDHYSYLSLPADAASGIESGDRVIIPDIGQQTDVLIGKVGKVIGIGPERIDFDNAMGPGDGGAPVINVKSGKVVALVTAMKRVDVSDVLAQAWPANPAPGAAGIIPYYGMRLTGVQGWETFDWSRFLAETLFLKQFHQNTRYLDSYLNGGGRRGRFRADGDESGPPDAKYYLNNAKLKQASDTYKQFSSGGADRNQQLDAARELLFDVQSMADTDMDTIQNGNNLYSFDRTWAQEEAAYRKAIKKELDDLSSNIVRFDGLARSR